jgi:hypothetical protein
MSKFEDRLWSDLVGSYGSELALAPRLERRRPGPSPLLAIALALALGAVLAVLALNPGTGVRAAYAIARNGDGTFTVTINELTGVGGANSELAELGLRARVAAVQDGCSASARPVAITPTLYAQMSHLEGQAVTIQPSAIPPGDTLVLAAHELRTGVGLSVGLYHGSAPACLPPGESEAG